MAAFTVPRYKELPIQEGAPAGSSWGVFDKDGRRDVYGTLNFITPEAVLRAKEEIQHGESVVLNLPLHLPYHPSRIGRTETKHTLLTGCHGAKCCDDEVVLNTQSSSQWDGLLHYANQEHGKYYNGVGYEDAAIKKTDNTLGIHCLAKRGGIVARGVLLDFVSYATRHGIDYTPLGPYAIKLHQVKEMIKEQGVDIRAGDILLIRCGLSKYLKSYGPADRSPFDNPQTHVGIDPEPEMLEWIWDSHLAAIGGDSLSCEAVPAYDGGFGRLHTAALAGWGMMLGELLDLESLAALTEKHKKWTFLLTICPLNLEGAAATIANTMAIM